MNRTTSVASGLLVGLLLSSSALAQLSREQLEKVRRERAAAGEGVTQKVNTESTRSPTRSLYSTVLEPVAIDHAKARDAFRWWSNATGIPLVINWKEMEAAGIDGETPIDLQLRSAPAAGVLSLMMKQLSPDQTLMYETTDWYVRIMTKAEADKDTVTLVYDIRDLTTRIPSFDNAPQFDLNQALSNTSSGGSSGGGAQAATTLFDKSDDKELQKTESERGEELAQLIREMIAPEIWQELGGQNGSIKYFSGRLIVKAPRYVHSQIGIPVVGGGSRDSGSRSYSAVAPAQRNAKNDVGGVRQNNEVVAGVGK